MPLLRSAIPTLTITCKNDDGSPEDWYELKTDVSAYEADSISDLMMELKSTFGTGDEKSETSGKFRQAEGRLFARQVFLVKWSHVENGNPVPLTVENIRRIPISHARVIDAHINSVLKQRDIPTDKTPVGKK